MEDLIRYLLENIAEDQSAIDIKKEQADEGTIFLVDVAEEDRGKVIGKNGKIISAIRNVVGIKAQKEDRKVFVQLDF